MNWKNILAIVMIILICSVTFASSANFLESIKSPNKSAQYYVTTKSNGIVEYHMSAETFNNFVYTESEGLTAKQLLENYPNLESIFRFNENNQQFQMVIRLQNGSFFGNDYSLIPGEGYIVKAKGNVVIRLLNENNNDQTFNLKPGFNTIGVTLDIPTGDKIYFEDTDLDLSKVKTIAHFKEGQFEFYFPNIQNGFGELKYFESYETYFIDATEDISFSIKKENIFGKSSPVFTNDFPPVTIYEEEYVKINFDYVDKDSDNVILTNLDAPAGVSIMFEGSTSEKYIEWTPSKGQAGTHTVSFTLDDGDNQTTATQVITVLEKPNNPPEFNLNINKTIYTEGETVYFEFNPLDADNDEITLDFSAVTVGTVNAGDFTWETKEGDAGTYNLLFELTDGKDTVTENVQIIVLPRENNAPTILISNLDSTSVTIEEEETLNFSVTATDEQIGTNEVELTLENSTDIVYSEFTVEFEDEVISHSTNCDNIYIQTKNIDIDARDQKIETFYIENKNYQTFYVDDIRTYTDNDYVSAYIKNPIDYVNANSKSYLDVRFDAYSTERDKEDTVYLQLKGKIGNKTCYFSDIEKEIDVDIDGLTETNCKKLDFKTKEFEISSDSRKSETVYLENELSEKFYIEDVEIINYNNEIDIYVTSIDTYARRGDDARVVLALDAKKTEETITTNFTLRAKGYFRDDVTCQNNEIIQTFSVTIFGKEEPKCSEIVIEANPINLNVGSILNSKFTVENRNIDTFKIKNVTFQGTPEIMLTPKDFTKEIRGKNTLEIPFEIAGNPTYVGNKAEVKLMIEGNFASGKSCSYTSIFKTVPVYLQEDLSCNILINVPESIKTGIDKEIYIDLEISNKTSKDAIIKLENSNVLVNKQYLNISPFEEKTYTVMIKGKDNVVGNIDYKTIIHGCTIPEKQTKVYIGEHNTDFVLKSFDSMIYLSENNLENYAKITLQAKNEDIVASIKISNDRGETKEITETINSYETKTLNILLSDFEHKSSNGLIEILTDKSTVSREVMFVKKEILPVDQFIISNELKEIDSNNTNIIYKLRTKIDNISEEEFKNLKLKLKLPNDWVAEEINQFNLNSGSSITFEQKITATFDDTNKITLYLLQDQAIIQEKEIAVKNDSTILAGITSGFSSMFTGNNWLLLITIILFLIVLYFLFKRNDEKDIFLEEKDEDQETRDLIDSIKKLNQNIETKPTYEETPTETKEVVKIIEKEPDIYVEQNDKLKRQKVALTKILKFPGWLYFVDKDGDVSRSKMFRKNQKA